jgi:hypothetical protein
MTIFFFLTFLSTAVNAQEAIGINFFDMANTNAGSPTCWGGGKGYAWLGSPSTFLNCTGGTNGGDVPVNMSIGAGSLVFTTTRPGGSGWCNIQFKLDGGHSVNFLRYGADPVLHLKLKWGAIAAGADYTIRLYDDHQIWNSYAVYNHQGNSYYSQSAAVNLSWYVMPSTTGWQDVYIPMSQFLTSNPSLDLTKISIVEFGATGNYSATNTLYVERFRIMRDETNQYMDMIKVNQLGYLPEQKKLAIVGYEVGTVSPAPTYFQVKDAETSNVVYQANLQLKNYCNATWNKSGDTTYYADFTAFNTPGRYVLYCPELWQTSVPFDISKKAFDSALRDSMRFFYYARSGSAMVEPYAEGHTRPAIFANNSTCVYDYDDEDHINHLQDYDPNNQRITYRNVQGGWFDAADLHMDVHNNVTTLWFLLESLKQQKDKFGPDVLNLPESNGRTNDLILLIKYELDWFKKMQNSNGSVHFIVIGEDPNQWYQQISDVSTGAACVLAGTFAKAYTLLNDVPGMESYASDLLTRSQSAWTWLMAHTSNYNPKGKNGSTWSYGITSDSSFRQYAAIELYIATGDSTYRTYFESRYTSAQTSMQGITAIGKGHMDYAETTRPVSATIKSAIRTAYIALADTLAANVDCNPYRIPVKYTTDISWGSSGLIACNAYTLLKVYEWTGNTAYRDAALDALEWIAGRNPINRIFITGYGDYLHGTDMMSFYWFDQVNPVPGYLCGNVNTQDFLYLYNKYPYKYYMNVQNASTLEPCLPWQAEWCYLLGYFAYDLKLPGKLDYAYLYDFSNAWLSTPEDANWNPNCNLVNTDEIINFQDFAAFANKWMVE